VDCAVAADVEAREVPLHRDLVGPRLRDLPRRHQGVAISGKVPGAAGRSHARRRVVLRRGVNRCDPCEFANIVLGVGHMRYFHVLIKSSVVVTVASSDSVLSMITVA
jgi:hypothetical protein